VQVETLDGGSSLSGLRKQIRAALKEAGAPPEEAFDCLVAVTEACTNALVHGRDDPQRPAPKIKWKVDKRKAHFEIEDFSNKEGRAKAEEELEIPRAGGYGLPMMRRLMDSVDIRFSPAGTVVVLEKRFA
jgi:anti-sigma regulatory factor (Ser/Thr protein kinase)